LDRQQIQPPPTPGQDRPVLSGIPTCCSTEGAERGEESPAAEKRKAEAGFDFMRSVRLAMMKLPSCFGPSLLTKLARTGWRKGKERKGMNILISEART
jgi:hypothetical protein